MKKTMPTTALLAAALLASAPAARSAETQPAAQPQPMEATMIPAVPELGTFGMMLAGCILLAAAWRITRP